MFTPILSHLRDGVELIAGFLGLEKLLDHILTIVISFVFFLLLHTVFSPAISRRLFPDTFGIASQKAQNKWSVHVVSQVHALLVVPLALRCLRLPALEIDHAFGWDDRAGTVQAISCGYFLWDSLDAVINFVCGGFVVHGLACLVIYTLAFRPFLAYYGVRCLLWEISTLFLNAHWFLEKTGSTASTFQLVNGVILLLTFFGVRIVYGGMVSYKFFCTLYEVRDRMPLAYLLGYAIGNITLQVLNWYWLAKMIIVMQKRFRHPNTERECEANDEKAYKGEILGQEKK